MSVTDNLHPTHLEKALTRMKAPRMVKRITFNPSEANPGETPYACMPKLNESKVLVPGSLVLRFDIDLSAGYANNFLVQKVSWALVDKLVVKFAGKIFDETVGHDIYKTFFDLFLSGGKLDNMVPWGIQGEDPCKICSKLGDKKISGVAADNRLNKIYGSKY